LPDWDWLLVTGAGFWFHLQTLEVRRQSLQWKHDGTCNKNFRQHFLVESRWP
jgi:hypothetical protein